LRKSYADNSYAIVKTHGHGGSNKNIVTLSSETARDIIMSSRAKNASQAKSYYRALEDNLLHYHPYIIDGIAA
jgi:phage anti-repressor protein